jgi:AcrR family transcriptional regulator
MMARRIPRQDRSAATVDAILDAVVRILKRQGLEGITTNRVAEVAGVSIGTLYQYFEDKRAIYVALHHRHVEAIDWVMQTVFIEQARSSLEDLVRALVETMVDAHANDPELYALLAHEVPHRGEGTRAFARRFHGACWLALSGHQRELGKGRDVDALAFVVMEMIDALCHGAVLRRPAAVSLDAAKGEAVRAVMAYLRG